MNQKYLVIAGPTASGKTDLALQLAQKLNGVLICCDSVQLYEGFCIGAAGPTREEMQSVPHRLFYSLKPNEDFDAASYRNAAILNLNEVWESGKLPIIVGGTGLYLRALIGKQWSENLPSDQKLRDELKTISIELLVEELRRVDPVRLSEIHENDRYRIERSVELCRLLGGPMSAQKAIDEVDERAYFVHLVPKRKTLHDRIQMRVHKMLDQGFVDEVIQLRRFETDSKKIKALGSIGYKQICEYLDGSLSESELPEKIIAATRQYAKRQCTWFKKMPAHLQFESGPTDMNSVIYPFREWLAIKAP